MPGPRMPPGFACPRISLPGHLERIAALSPLAQRCLLLTSLAVSPTVPLLQHATGVTLAELEAALAEGVDQGLLDGSTSRLRFVHPLYASAAVANANQAACRAAHRALAGLTASSEERANHLDLATIGPSEETAHALVVAAREAFNRGAASSGQAMAKRAMDRAAVGSPSIPVALTLIGEVEFLRGNLPVAERHLREAIDLLLGEDSASARSLLFRTIFERDANNALPYLEQAIAVTPPGAGLVDLQMWLGHLCTLQLRWVDAIAAADQAAEGATAIGDEGLLAETTAVGVVIHMLAGHGLNEQRLESALARRDLGRPSHAIADPLFVAACAYNWDGQHDQAIKATHALAEVQAEREPTAIDLFGLAPGIISACAMGRTDIALTFAKSATDRSSAPPSVFHILATGVAEASLAATHGDADGAVATLARVAAATTQSGLDVPQVLLLMASPVGTALAMAGRFQEVDRQFGPLAQFAMAVDYPEPSVVSWVADWAEALTELGRANEARPVLDWLEQRAKATGRYWVTGLVARGRAQVAGATGDLDTAIQLAEQAIEIFAKPPQPFETARTQLALGSFLRRKRSRKAAAAAFAQARAFFSSADLPHLVALADAEIERVHGSHSAPHELTAGEAAVAELAAAGHTNRVIAARLFISEKTVEAQLTKVFRKLNISRRIELIAALAT
jgi:DNA-binding CsgD family transcriptional regulator